MYGKVLTISKAQQMRSNIKILLIQKSHNGRNQKKEQLEETNKKIETMIVMKSIIQ